MSESQTRCEVQGNHVLMCEALSDCAEMYGQGTRYQGIKRISLVNSETMASRHLLLVKSGKHAKNGVIMNFCPFCGKDIVPMPQKEGARA